MDLPPFLEPQYWPFGIVGEILCQKTKISSFWEILESAGAGLKESREH